MVCPNSVDSIHGIKTHKWGLSGQAYDRQPPSVSGKRRKVR